MMFLRKSYSHGKIYLSFVQGFRDENGNTKQKTIYIDPDYTKLSELKVKK